MLVSGDITDQKFRKNCQNTLMEKCTRWLRLEVLGDGKAPMSTGKHTFWSKHLKELILHGLVHVLKPRKFTGEHTFFAYLYMYL